jgi:hypothetical protein
MNELASTGKVRRLRNCTGTGPHRRRSRKRYLPPRAAQLGLRDLYGRLVAATLAVRRDRFSKHVKRVTAHVKQTKGWSLRQLLETAKVAKPVYYRWLNGDWTEDLEPSPIVRFHDAADWPVSDAWDILWPGKYGRREPTAPVPVTPEMELLLRKLNDPNTSKEDLYLIQTTFEMLLARVAPEARPRRASS